MLKVALNTITKPNPNLFFAKSKFVLFIIWSSCLKFHLIIEKTQHTLRTIASITIIFYISLYPMPGVKGMYIILAQITTFLYRIQLNLTMQYIYNTCALSKHIGNMCTRLCRAFSRILRRIHIFTYMLRQCTCIVLILQF